MALQAPRRASAITARPEARKKPTSQTNSSGDPALAMAQAEKIDKANGHGHGGYLPEIQRMLPQSAEAEEAILSCVFLLPRQVIDLCRDEGVTKNTFHIPAHASIYETMLALDLENTPIDLITVTQAMRDAKTLDQSGGPARITEIAMASPTAANARSYVETLHAKETLRNIITLCTEIASRAYDEQDNAAGLVEELEKGASNIAKGFVLNTAEIDDMKTLVQQSIERADQCRSGKKDSGISTGLAHFDDLTGGLNAFSAIAGKTSDGKTGLAMTFAKNIAIQSEKRVGIISLEMTRHELTDRLIAMHAPCNLFDYINGRYEDSEIDQLAAAVTAISQAPIFIDDEHGIGITKLCAKARAMRRKHRIEVLFIDYFQLLSEDRTATKKNTDETITARLTIASQVLKQLQKELGIPLVVLVQEDDKGQPKWAKAIQDDANNYYQIRHTEEGSNIHVWKARSGQRFVDAKVHFNRPFVLFENPAPEEAKPAKKKK